MPWQVKELFTMKREFVVFAQQEGSNMAELCRRFGISRVCGYSGCVLLKKKVTVG
jgi:transposase-like protein